MNNVCGFVRRGENGPSSLTHSGSSDNYLVKRLLNKATNVAMGEIYILLADKIISALDRRLHGLYVQLSRRRHEESSPPRLQGKSERQVIPVLPNASPRSPSA